MTCAIDGCDRPVRVPSRGWCSAHYQRWRTHGHPLGAGKIMLHWPENLLRRLRFMPPGQLATGCIEFTGALNKGYGITRKDGRSVQAHRVAYELVRGPVTGGLVLDHLCENPPCVNPGHLEPVTTGENTRRARRTPAACKVDGCSKRPIGHGWCSAHYTRWRRHGDPLAGRRSPGTAPGPPHRSKAELAARVVAEGGTVDPRHPSQRRDEAA